MVTRVIMQQGLIRVSKPGQDVYTAAERDLLLSISARSCQVIARGYIAFPQGSNQAPNGGANADFVVSVYFPYQQTVPDAWVVLSGGANSTDAMFAGKPIYFLNFYNDHFDCGGRWAGPNLVSSVPGVSYAVFRKRLDS